MKVYAGLLQWGLLTLVALGLTVSSRAHAQEPSKESEQDAEEKQAAEEDAQEQRERERVEQDKRVESTWQELFTGTFRRLSESEASESASSQTVGSFVTALTDPKPGRRYLVKVEDKLLIEALKRFEGKPLQLAGKLRNIDPNGVAKYLIVTRILTQEQTPPPVRRRGLGGI